MLHICSTQSHAIWVVTLTHFSLLPIILFFIVDGYDVAVMYGMSGSTQQERPHTPLVSVEARRNVDNIHRLKVIRRLEFNSGEAMIVAKTMAEVYCKEVAKTVYIVCLFSCFIICRLLY